MPDEFAVLRFEYRKNRGKKRGKETRIKEGEGRPARKQKPRRLFLDPRSNISRKRFSCAHLVFFHGAAAFV